MVMFFSSIKEVILRGLPSKKLMQYHDIIDDVVPIKKLMHKWGYVCYVLSHQIKLKQ